MMILIVDRRRDNPHGVDTIAAVSQYIDAAVYLLLNDLHSTYLQYCHVTMLTTLFFVSI